MRNKAKTSAVPSNLTGVTGVTGITGVTCFFRRAAHVALVRPGRLELGYKRSLAPWLARRPWCPGVTQALKALTKPSSSQLSNVVCSPQSFIVSSEKGTAASPF